VLATNAAHVKPRDQNLAAFAATANADAVGPSDIATDFRAASNALI
jgi:hypothetical protein